MIQKKIYITNIFKFSFLVINIENGNYRQSIMRVVYAAEMIGNTDQMIHA